MSYGFTFAHQAALIHYWLLTLSSAHFRLHSRASLSCFYSAKQSLYASINVFIRSNCLWRLVEAARGNEAIVCEAYAAGKPRLFPTAQCDGTERNREPAEDSRSDHDSLLSFTKEVNPVNQRKSHFHKKIYESAHYSYHFTGHKRDTRYVLHEALKSQATASRWKSKAACNLCTSYFPLFSRC